MDAYMVVIQPDRKCPEETVFASGLLFDAAVGMAAALTGKKRKAYVYHDGDLDGPPVWMPGQFRQANFSGLC